MTRPDSRRGPGRPANSPENQPPIDDAEERQSNSLDRLIHAANCAQKEIGSSLSDEDLSAYLSEKTVEPLRQRVLNDIGASKSLRSKLIEKLRLDNNERAQSDSARKRQFPSFDKIESLSRIYGIHSGVLHRLFGVVGIDDDQDPEEILVWTRRAVCKSRIEQALYYCSHAISVLQRYDYGDDLIAEFMILRAIALRDAGYFDHAVRALSDLDRLSSDQEVSLSVRASLILASTYARRGLRSRAVDKASESLMAARRESLDHLEAASLDLKAHCYYEERRNKEAMDCYRDASSNYDLCGAHYEAMRAQVNIDGCLVAAGHITDGIRSLRRMLRKTRKERYQSLQAIALSFLGEAYYRAKRFGRAVRVFALSDSLISVERLACRDLMFRNTFYVYKMRASDKSRINNRIRFRRLTMLRSSTKRLLPEIEEFDAKIARVPLSEAQRARLGFRQRMKDYRVEQRNG